MSALQPATVAQHLWRDIAAQAPAQGDHGNRARLLTDADPSDQAIAEEVVIFLGSGDRPTPGLIEAHLRWHACVADAVSLGTLVPDDGSDDSLGLILDLTRDLTDLAGGLHLAAAEGSIGVRRELLDAAGGVGNTPAPLRRIDVLQRLHNAGAVFVAEPGAVAHGVGSGLARAVAGSIEQGSALELSHPGEASLAALPPLRRIPSARRHLRPAVAVNLDLSGVPAASAEITLGAALGGSLGDVEVRIQGEHLAPAVLTAIEADPRAGLAPSSLGDPACQSPIQISVPAPARLDPRTLADLHALILAEGVGALHVTVPGATPQDAMIEVVATGAWRRAQRLATVSGEEAPAIMGRLYGERWVSGVEVSTRMHGVEEPQVTEHGPLAAATDPELERANHIRFRERANDMAQRVESFDRKTLAERLRARAVRQEAERVESRLD